MSIPPFLKSYAPGIALAVLALGFVALQFRVPEAPKPKAPPETPPAASVAAPPASAMPAPAVAPPAVAPVAPPAAAPVAPVASPPAPAAPAVAGALAPVPVASTWPTYHGGPDLSGYSDITLPDSPAVRWRYIADGAIRQAPVGDADAVYACTTSGVVLALDTQGQERWKRALTRPAADGSGETPERVEAPIACFAGTVYVGAVSGTLYALDAATGSTRWTHDLGGDILGTVNAYLPADPAEAPRVYVIERSEGRLYCLNPATGERLWRTDPVARCDGSPAVATGRVIYGTCASATQIHAAVEGSLRFSVSLCADCQIASGPASVGDEIYSGDHSGRFFRLDAATGKPVWVNQDGKKEIFSTAALAGDLVIFGSEDRGVYALERATGAQRWRHDAGGPPSSPVVVGDKVAFSVDGALRLIRVDTGAPVWSHEVSDAISAPSVLHGGVVVGSEDGTLVAFGAPPG